MAGRTGKMTAEQIAKRGPRLVLGDDKHIYPESCVPKNVRVIAKSYRRSYLIGLTKQPFTASRKRDPEGRDNAHGQE